MNEEIDLLSRLLTEAFNQLEGDLEIMPSDNKEELTKALNIARQGAYKSLMLAPYDPDNMTGHQLHTLRKKKWWTLEKLAEKSGLSKSHLIRAEKMETIPKKSAILALHALYETEI